MIIIQVEGNVFWESLTKIIVILLEKGGKTDPPIGAQGSSD